MIWQLLILSFGLAAATRDLPYVGPEYLDYLREKGRDEELARLLGLDVNLVRSNNTDTRSGDPIYNHVSLLGDILVADETDRQGINIRKYTGSRWPKGRVPYAISTSDFTGEQIRFIEDALGQFNARVATNGKYVTLVKKTNNDRDYIQVISGNGCYSYVGKVGGAQALSLQRDGCLSKGTVQHEFMHAVGFTHEQNRADRDNFVDILWHNIPQNWHSQYKKENENDYVNIGQYDYYSVMHYGMGAPDTGKDAFRLKRGGVDRNRVGRSDGLTDWDVYKINMLYWMS